MGMLTTAETNFRYHLQENNYPGRGLVIGRAEDGDWLQLYWITGRSANSRNRRLVSNSGVLRTEPLSPSDVTDPSHIFYEAMLELPDIYLVSNGDQTRTLADTIANGGTFEEALATRQREDDTPNFTSRISGLLDLRGDMHGALPRVALSILRANDVDSAYTDYSTFRPASPPSGYGLCLTTYTGDGDPLPAFRGDPLWLPLFGNSASILDRYWAALDADNRIALAVKRIPATGGPGEIFLRNRSDDE